MVRLSWIVISVSDFVTHVMVVVSQDVIDLAQSPALKLVSTNSALSRGKSNECSVCLKKISKKFKIQNFKHITETYKKMYLSNN